jgi:hypothetical protein
MPREARTRPTKKVGFPPDMNPGPASHLLRIGMRSAEKSSDTPRAHPARLQRAALHPTPSRKGPHGQLHKGIAHGPNKCTAPVTGMGLFKDNARHLRDAAAYLEGVATPNTYLVLRVSLVRQGLAPGLEPRMSRLEGLMAEMIRESGAN